DPRRLPTRPIPELIDVRNHHPEVDDRDGWWLGERVILLQEELIPLPGQDGEACFFADQIEPESAIEREGARQVAYRQFENQLFGWIDVTVHLCLRGGDLDRR